MTGDVGSAYLGLQLLEREKQLFMNDSSMKPDFSNQSYVIERQLKPEARKDAIEYFKKSDLTPTAMIDISDGLSSDIMHICKHSDVGAFLEEGKIPIKDESKKLALEFNLDPVTCALNGGEDYELLFTTPHPLNEHLHAQWTARFPNTLLTKIGTVTQHTKTQLEGGWEHFLHSSD